MIFHVTEESKYLSKLEEVSKVNLAEFDRDSRKVALNEIRPIEDSFSQMGFKVKVIIIRGIVFEKILKTSEEEDVSLIVMGSRTSRIREMLSAPRHRWWLRNLDFLCAWSNDNLIKAGLRLNCH